MPTIGVEGQIAHSTSRPGGGSHHVLPTRASDGGPRLAAIGSPSPIDVTTPSTVDRLAALELLEGIPRKQLEWLAEHGALHRLEDGGEIRGGGQELGLFVLISGRFSVRMDHGGVTRRMREVPAGGITGYLPYSRIVDPRGYLVAEGDVEYLEIRREDIPDMTRACYEFTATCVHEMLDRVRVFKADDKHQEKMAALGRLSAGLAHELNNPSSAVARAAGELQAAHSEALEAARALAATELDGDASRVLAALEGVVAEGSQEVLSPLDRADLEDRVMEWLESHEVDAALAYALVERGVDVDDLEEAAESLDPAGLGPVLRYLAADANVRDLASGIASAAARIHALVTAVKKHTNMDRAPTVEAIDVESHLRDAIALVRSRASARNVSLDLTAEADVPPVKGSVADLNQVWIHLLDNAIEASPEGGIVTLDLVRGPGQAVVRVVDGGPGIPDEDQERVFEPFFTTKEVGQGKGLGLDVVRTVVSAHRGTVELTSDPGRTEFRIVLPASPDGA